MMKFVLPVLVLAACAKTGTMVSDVRTRPSAKLELAFTPKSQSFPKAIKTELPSADRRVGQIRAEAGDEASADVQMCVGADGHVLGVLLIKSSKSPALDGAILRDAPHWQFSSGDADGRTCETATITCHVHS